MMHDREKSDSAIVAGKPTNKAGSTAAEPVESRAGTKRNADEQSTHRTLSWERVPQALRRVRQTDAVRTQGRRSYGAGGGGCGTFIVHTN
jgi:RNA-directed DNA polymerase